MDTIDFDDGVYVGEVVMEDGEMIMHGKGHYTYNNGDSFEGRFEYDTMQGFGKYTWSDGTIYEGEFDDGVQHGRGVLRAKDTYTGDWCRDKRHGTGRCEYSNKEVYSGEWLDDMRHGQGSMDGPPSDPWHYEGEWREDHREGKGMLCAAGGDEYDGEFHNDTFHGQGKYTWSNGSVFTGDFVNGVKHGKGCERRSDGDWRAGTWTNNVADPGQEFHTAAKQNIDHIDEKVKELKLVSVSKAAQEAMSHAAPDQQTVTKQVIMNDADLQGWHKIKLLGKGSFGAVYEAVLPSGRTVCVKIVELGAITEADGMEKLRNEIALMKRLNHMNIVQYYGSTEDKTNNALNIFMEYVTGGSLNQYIKKFVTIPIETIRQWTFQMLCGVRYLHESGIVHRDIKGDNILVTMDGVLKLADFGCSKSIDDVCSKTHGCTTMVGTPYWMAPEVIMCDGAGYGMKSDIWSVGCTIVEMITGKPPWPECNSMWAAVYKIANSKGLPTEIPKNLDSDLMNFLELTFERDPKKRASAVDLLNHEFVRKMPAR